MGTYSMRYSFVMCGPAHPPHFGLWLALGSGFSGMMLYTQTPLFSSAV